MVGRKTVLITGCSSGFGRLMTELFLKSGQWKVIATTRNPEQLLDLSCANLVIVNANVASKDERLAVVKQVESACENGLHCLINNAGYGLTGPLETLAEEQIRQQFEVNFFAPLLLTRDLLPALRKAKGKVVNISSVLGFVGMPLQSLYVASKFALEGLTESLSYELSVHGIQVCLVEPGAFRTSFAGNIQWADDNKIDEVYARQMQGYRAFLKRKLDGQGNNPRTVAKAVFELCQKNSVPLRVRLGSDTQALYYLKRTLPQRVNDFLMHRMSRTLLDVQA